MQPTSPSSACNQPPTTDDVRTERAHVFFWTELCIAAGVSVIGNATQAVLHTTALPLLAATVAVIIGNRRYGNCPNSHITPRRASLNTSSAAYSAIHDAAQQRRRNRDRCFRLRRSRPRPA